MVSLLQDLINLKEIQTFKVSSTLNQKKMKSSRQSYKNNYKNSTHNHKKLTNFRNSNNKKNNKSIKLNLIKI